jgi:hypothetical protein
MSQSQPFFSIALSQHNRAIWLPIVIATAVFLGLALIGVAFPPGDDKA